MDDLIASAGSSFVQKYDREGCPIVLPETSNPLQDGLFRFLVENTVDLIVLGNAGRNRTYVSPSSREMLGFEPAEMLGRHGFELVHPDDLKRVGEVFAKIGPNHPTQDVKFRMRHAAGHYIWIDARYRHLPADDGVLAVLRDVTAQMLAEEKLAQATAKLEMANIILQGLAHTDGLTGLSNRRSFDRSIDDVIGQARRQAMPVGLVLLDLDHFKAFNDFYGHLGGDDCLRQVSRCIRATLCRPGDQAARYGGEEIAVLLPATDAEGSAEVAQRICTAISRLRIQHKRSDFGFVTVSGGVAAMRPAELRDTSASLIAAADRALYMAKAAGRNCVRSYESSAPALV